MPKKSVPKKQKMKKATKNKVKVVISDEELFPEDKNESLVDAAAASAQQLLKNSSIDEQLDAEYGSRKVVSVNDDVRYENAGLLECEKSPPNYAILLNELSKLEGSSALKQQVIELQKKAENEVHVKRDCPKRDQLQESSSNIESGFGGSKLDISIIEKFLEFNRQNQPRIPEGSNVMTPVTKMQESGGIVMDVSLPQSSPANVMNNSAQGLVYPHVNATHQDVAPNSTQQSKFYINDVQGNPVLITVPSDTQFLISNSVSSEDNSVVVAPVEGLIESGFIQQNLSKASLQVEQKKDEKSDSVPNGPENPVENDAMLSDGCNIENGNVLDVMKNPENTHGEILNETVSVVKIAKNEDDVKQEKREQSEEIQEETGADDADKSVVQSVMNETSRANEKDKSVVCKDQPPDNQNDDMSVPSVTTETTRTNEQCEDQPQDNKDRGLPEPSITKGPICTDEENRSVLCKIPDEDGGFLVPGVTEETTSTNEQTADMDMDRMKGVKERFVNYMVDTPLKITLNYHYQKKVLPLYEICRLFLGLNTDAAMVYSSFCKMRAYFKIHYAGNNVYEKYEVRKFEDEDNVTITVAVPFVDTKRFYRKNVSGKQNGERGEEHESTERTAKDKNEKSKQISKRDTNVQNVWFIGE